MYDILVVEGASSKIYAYIGALKVLEERKILDKFSHFVGSSSGSILCVLVSLGYTVDEIKNVLYNINVENVIKKSKFSFINLIYGLFNLKNNYGYCYVGNYISILKDIIKAKSGNQDLTFKQLNEQFNKVLVITGTCINKRETHYYNYTSNPDMPIWKAIQISTCIPFILPVVKWEDDYLVDGGLLENYPIYYINEDLTFPNSKEKTVCYCENTHTGNKRVLGLKIITNDNVKNEELFKGNDKINDIKDFSLSILNTTLTHIERNYIKEGYFESSVCIEVPSDIKFYNLSLDDSEKQFLYNCGVKYCNEYFDLI